MKNVYAYVRISSKKQDEGVSLDVQKDVVARYALSKNLKIIKWFEEIHSASKGVRPKFSEMMISLSEGKAEGCVFHKIDRISRNDRDWMTINELADAGFDMCSAVENINLKESNVRLTADIQAVIASNYSRNLASEVRKGIYGRLNQGIYPFKAPVGYLDNGKGGKLKTIDQKKSPIIKNIFKLYTEKGKSIREIHALMQTADLRTSRGKKVTRNGINAILNNPFYAGLIKVKGEIYKGKHKAIIPIQTYNRGQEIMLGKTNGKRHKHEYLFRKMIRCTLCNRSLVPEKQKGHVYYRCQTKTCLTKTMREDLIVRYVTDLLQAIQLPKNELNELESHLNTEQKEWVQAKVEILNTLSMQIGDYEARLDKLTDALIDGIVDKKAYQAKREKLIIEQRSLEEQKKSIQTEKGKILQQMKYFLELLKHFDFTYDLGNHDEKRDFLKKVFSNLEVKGKEIVFTIRSPYYDFLNRDMLHYCALKRVRARTKIVYLTSKSSPIVPRKLRKSELQQLYKQFYKTVALSSPLNY